MKHFTFNSIYLWAKKKKLLFMATFTSAIPSLWDAPVKTFVKFLLNL
jgi:hypothetical protein